MTRLAVLAAAALLLSACAHLDPEDRAPRTNPVARLAPAGPSPWLVDFGDPALARLLRDADLGSLDVKIALARVARARADVATARADRALHVSVGAEAAGGGTSFRDTRSAATPTFEAAYEVDLWGRLAQAQKAAGHDQSAAEADVPAARLLVAAETVRVFAALRFAQDEVAGQIRRAERLAQGVALNVRRAEAGATTPDAVAAARQALIQARAALASAREDEALQTARLGDLLGQPALVVPPGPQLAAASAVATSADIVEARPDVRAALARLQAADDRRAEAVAASRPQLRITALLGAPDAAIATLLDARALAWAVAASLNHALLDGGAARARVKAAGADADVADLQYRKAVVTGWSEVRAAVIDGARADRERAAALAMGDLARNAARVQEVRRREGVADGLDAVAAGAATETALDQLRAADLAAVEARVRLALATGGL